MKPVKKSSIKADELRALRLSKKITIENAAHSVQRSIRAWQNYEDLKKSDPYSNIPLDILNTFLKANRIFWPTAKVISINAYKGGIGKSPITVAVAASFAAKGSRVAVVTNDGVYRSYSEQELSDIKLSEKSASAVDFYDEYDIIMYQGELNKLKERMEKNQEPPTHIVAQEDFETLTRKQSTKLDFDTLKNKYDLVFLDLNHKPDQILIKSDIVALLVDITCPMSSNSSKRYCEKIRTLNAGNIEPIHILLTNFSPTPSLPGLITSESPAQTEIQEILVWRSAISAKNYRALQEVGVPFLKSRFSSDHEYHINLHNESLSFEEGFCYFDTIMDIAPNSLAAIEVHEVSNELEELLWAQKSTPTL